MIRGVIILLKSGLPIAQCGFEKSEILSPLMSVAISLSEEMGMGLLRAMEYGNYRLYILTSNVNPEVLVVVATDKEDIASEIKARELVNKIDRVIPKESFNLVTGTLQDTVLRIIDDFLKVSPELPSFSEIVDLSKVIFSGLSTEIAIQINREMKDFARLEKEEELKNRFIPKTEGPSDPEKTLDECIKNFFEWRLLDAYSKAYSLRSIESFSDIGSLLGIKIGLMILRMPPNFKSLSKTDIKGLMDFEVQSVNPLIAELIKKEVESALEGKFAEYRNFLTSHIEEIAEIFRNSDSKMKDVYSVLLFSVSRYVLKSPLGDELINYYRNKSNILYEITYSTLKEIEMFESLYAPKTWLDVQKYLTDNKLHYMEIKDKYKSLLGKTLIRKLLSSRKKEVIETSIYALSSIRPYILSSLAAAESYGLSIKDRQQILLDAYNLVMEDVYEIIKASPPLSIGTYFDFYQLILHLLMYLGWVTNGDMKDKIWREGSNLSKEAFYFFYKLYARNRITLLDFISRVSPVVFIMSKSALRLGETPKELFYLIRLLASFGDNDIKEIDSQADPGRFAALINNVMAIVTTASRMQLASLKEKTLTHSIDILRRLITWAIHKGEFSREIVDNYIDAVYKAIKLSNDKQKCEIILRDLIDYSQALVRDPDENKFEVAIFYKRAGEVLTEYYVKFKSDGEIIHFARTYLSKSLEIWRSEGYKAIPKEIEEMLAKLPP